MYAYRNDNITSIERKLNRAEVGDVNYNQEMDVKYIFRFYHAKDNSIIEYDDDFKSHAIVKFFIGETSTDGTEDLHDL